VSKIGGGDVFLYTNAMNFDPWGVWMQVLNDAGSSFPLVLNPSGGNVGIGTTSPTEQFSVANRMYIGGTGTSTVENNLYVMGTLRATNSYVGDLIFGNQFRFTETSSTSSLYLLNAAGEIVTVFDQTGNVGIGTTEPGAKLDVNGDIAKQGTIIYGVVAGGTCLTGKVDFWDGYTYTYGGATCSGASINELNCPTGTTKWITMKMTNAGTGGEGGICIK